MSDNELLKALTDYAKSDAYPFHMPGHKRNIAALGDALPYSLDITEIDGFDDLHVPEGTLLRLEERLARLYGATHSFALVNGSTCGILAGIAAAARQNDKILLARNCHKSVYNAITLLGLAPIYIQPPTEPDTGIFGSIPPESIRTALDEHPDIRLIVLTSPTYDGVLSDIAAITEIAHQKDIPVLVDEAHGAHLAFTAQKQYSAVFSGADIVIHSLHKTLPALTQTAAAHLFGDRVSPAVFRQKLSVFETSSPSYVLLASIAECVRFLEENAESAFQAYARRLRQFSDACQALSLQHLSVLCKGADTPKKHPAFFAFDCGKLPVITAKSNIDGRTLLHRLRTEFAVEGEMAAIGYALLMTSVCDTDNGFIRLTKALSDIDQTLSDACNPPRFPAAPLPKQICSPANAALRTTHAVPLRDAIGHISGETVWCYPPGIPLLTAGEAVEETVVCTIEQAKRHGLSVQSSGQSLPYISVFD